MAQGFLGYIAARDYRLMRRVNGWRAPRWLQLWMVCATRGGDGWLWYIMAGYFYPDLLPGLMFCAISVAISRIVLGMHFLSDVVAGAGIGASLAYSSVILMS